MEPCILYAVVEPGDALVRVLYASSYNTLVHHSVVNVTLYTADQDKNIKQVCNKTIEASYNYTILAPGVVAIGNLTYPTPTYVGFAIGDRVAVAVSSSGRGFIPLKLPGGLGEDRVSAVASAVEDFIRRHEFNYTVNYTLTSYGWIINVDGLSPANMFDGYAVFSGPPPGPGFTCCNITFLPEETSGVFEPTGEPVIIDMGDVMYVYSGSSTVWVLVYYNGQLFLHTYMLMPGAAVFHWETMLLLNLSFPEFYTTDVIASILFPYPINDSVLAVDPRFPLIINGRSPIIATGDRTIEDTIWLLTPWSLREHFQEDAGDSPPTLPVELFVRGSLQVFVENISVERVEAGIVEPGEGGFGWLALLLAVLGVAAGYAILTRRYRAKPVSTRM
ncbi:MAG: hypothetical protein GSR73_00275 [Desulfurococcales archaeon]|nr:hypothetical protein [Desulfurococcales archaeon]